MTWEACDAVERVPGKMSGESVIKGTRVLADTIIDNFASGSTLEEIYENYPHVSEDAIRRVIAHFEGQHQVAS